LSKERLLKQGELTGDRVQVVFLYDSHFVSVQLKLIVFILDIRPHCLFYHLIECLTISRFQDWWNNKSLINLNEESRDRVKVDAVAGKLTCEILGTWVCVWTSLVHIRILRCCGIPVSLTTFMTIQLTTEQLNTSVGRIS